MLTEDIQGPRFVGGVPSQRFIDPGPGVAGALADSINSIAKTVAPIIRQRRADQAASADTERTNEIARYVSRSLQEANSYFSQTQDAMGQNAQMQAAYARGISMYGAELADVWNDISGTKYGDLLEGQVEMVQEQQQAQLSRFNTIAGALGMFPAASYEEAVTRSQDPAFQQMAAHHEQRNMNLQSLMLDNQLSTQQRTSRENVVLDSIGAQDYYEQSVFMRNLMSGKAPEVAGDGEVVAWVQDPSLPPFVEGQNNPAYVQRLMEYRNQVEGGFNAAIQINRDRGKPILDSMLAQIDLQIKYASGELEAEALEAQNTLIMLNARNRLLNVNGMAELEALGTSINSIVGGLDAQAQMYFIQEMGPVVSKLTEGVQSYLSNGLARGSTFDDIVNEQDTQRRGEMMDNISRLSSDVILNPSVPIQQRAPVAAELFRSLGRNGDLMSATEIESASSVLTDPEVINLFKSDQGGVLAEDVQRGLYEYTNSLAEAFHTTLAQEFGSDFTEGAEWWRYLFPSDRTVERVTLGAVRSAGGLRRTDRVIDMRMNDEGVLVFVPANPSDNAAARRAHQLNGTLGRRFNNLVKVFSHTTQMNTNYRDNARYLLESGFGSGTSKNWLSEVVVDEPESTVE